MDDPSLPPDRHVRALRGLRRLNRASGGARALFPHVRRVARARDRSNPLRIADIACGGGDVAVALLARARRAGIDARLTGVDVSPVALDEAERTAAAADLTGHATWARADVLRDGPGVSAEVVVCNLFLHHLTADDAVALLAHLRDAVRPGGCLLVNDLRRGTITRALVTLGSYALTRSDVVRTDGPRSARAAWTPDELRRLAAAAGLTGAVVRPARPCRMLLHWTAP